jgi:chromosome partitioning protein
MTNTSPPIFIAFASSKGGVGKSTSCVSLAGALAHHGYPVHIVDFDQTQTLYRWYTDNEGVRAIPGITLEQGPAEADIKPFLKNLFLTRKGFVLIDLAGSLTKHMLQIAAFASLTITPAKLSEPDVLEAKRLHLQLLDVARQAGRQMKHRILINDVSGILANVHLHMLKVINESDLTRFQTLMHTRAPYSELFLTGQPPHFNVDQQRPATQKAVEELEHILQEVFDALTEESQEKLAA